MEESGPYAANTPLGWVVFGPLKGEPSNFHLSMATENFVIKALSVIESNEIARARQILKDTTVRVEGMFQT